MFKNFRRPLFVVASLGTLALGAGSAIAASTSANAGADVVAPVTITKDADMHFGDVLSGATSGTVVLTPAGSRSVTGGVSLGNDGIKSAAAFTVGGDADAVYTITLPSSAVTLTSGANTMTVDTFTSNPSGTGTLAGGTDALAVGATLNVGANQATGSYSGSFNVTVAYQ